MHRVLVTRPQPGASRTARRLEAMGYEAIVLPLSETRPLAVDTSTVPAEAAAVAVTSANAIRHASKGLLRQLTPLPCFVVGGATAEAARLAGLRDVRAGPGDADGLAQAIAAARPAGPVVHLCGRVRRSSFEAALAAAGIPLLPVETYDTVALQPAALPAAIGPGDAALLYSVVAAEAFAMLAARPDGAALRQIDVLCLSERIATPLRPRFGGRIAIAAEPTEPALLSLLGSLE